jgi:hypothetical protein
MQSYHPAFETLSQNDLSEFRARGIHLRHRKTGCEVYKLLSADEENSFAFVFRTPPRDSTGVAHIVEHSVLCGSESYPVKDSFLVMSRRSLATFLNAFTWPDKTVYPGASAVPADFWNLLSVYGDAVFHPLITRETFLQEAHHLEYGQSGALEVKGVVYNEMRGDYSSADSLAGTASSTGLFTKGHPYSFDSGGDPQFIPDLSYEAFRKFWSDHYHPSNCRIFFHGNIDIGEELAFLEDRFLVGVEARIVDTTVPVQPRISEPRMIEVPYPVTEGAEAVTQIVVNWLCAEIGDEVEAFGLELLSEILLGHDGSPLSSALRTSDLGEDLSPQCGLDTVFRQLIFSAGLRGAQRGAEREVEDLIISTVKEYIAPGIPAEAREAALHSIAFANREVRRDSSSFGLRLLFRSLRGWLHGAGPEATLSFEKVLAGFESEVARDPRWLEGLAEKWIVSNSHRTTVTVFPENGLLERNKAETERLLSEREARLGDEERAEIRKTQERLLALQSSPNSEESLALLPMLRVADLPRRIETIRRESDRLGDIPVSIHPLFTNGIIYLELAFPIDRLPPSSMVWLPLLSRFVSGAGLPGLSWGRVAEIMALNAGGFGASLDSGSLARAGGDLSRPETRSYVIFKLKTLADRFPRALEVALRLLAEADANDIARVGDLLAELGNDILSAIVPAGNSFALARVGARWSEALAIEELWRGTNQIQFVKSLRAEAHTERVASVLAGLRSSVFSRKGLRLNLSADEALLPAARAALEKSLALLPEAASGSLPDSWSIDPPSPHEAWTISAQVGYAAVSCPAARFGDKAFAHQTVLAHMMTRGALWDELRVRRGAYGAAAYIESLEGVALFSTYRDPSPAESIGFFRESLLAAAGGQGMEAAIESVIGACGRDIKPLLPEEAATVDFRRELYGISDELRQLKRSAIIETTAGELREAAASLAESLGTAGSVLISREADVQLTRRLRPETRIIEAPL